MRAVSSWQLRVQAVAEDGEMEEDTEQDRKALLRQERTGTLAYDAEQQSLRTALKEKLAASAGSDDEAGGLQLSHRAAPLPEAVCALVCCNAGFVKIDMLRLLCACCKYQHSDYDAILGSGAVHG